MEMYFCSIMGSYSITGGLYFLNPNVLDTTFSYTNQRERERKKNKETVNISWPS